MADSWSNKPSGREERNDWEIVTDCARAREIFVKLERHSQFALDLEGRNLGAGGTLSLISIADPDGHIYIIDVISATGVLGVDKLKQILESTSTEKVIHAAVNDSAQLHKHGIYLKNVFDTQTFQLAIDSRGGDTRYVKKTNFLQLCEAYGIRFEEKELKMEFKNVMSGKGKFGFQKNSSDTSFTLERPLTSAFCRYAAADVRYLLRLRDLMERHLETAYFDGTKARIIERYQERRDESLRVHTSRR